MKINKKGLSTVVASVILIVLTVTAIVIIAQFAVPFVKNSLNKGSECLDYQQYYKFDNSFDYNCRSDGISYIFSVSANGDKELEENVKGIKVVFYNETGSVPLEVFDGKETNGTFTMFNPTPSTKTIKISPIRTATVNIYLFNIPRSGEVKSYIYNSTSLFNRMESYVVLNSGRTCETKTDEITLEDC